MSSIMCSDSSAKSRTEDVLVASPDERPVFMHVPKILHGSELVEVGSTESYAFDESEVRARTLNRMSSSKIRPTIERVKCQPHESRKSLKVQSPSLVGKFQGSAGLTPRNTVMCQDAFYRGGHPDRELSECCVEQMTRCFPVSSLRGVLRASRILAKWGRMDGRVRVRMVLSFPWGGTIHLTSYIPTYHWTRQAMSGSGVMACISLATTASGQTVAYRSSISGQTADCNPRWGAVSGTDAHSDVTKLIKDMTLLRSYRLHQKHLHIHEPVGCILNRCTLKHRLLKSHARHEWMNQGVSLCDIRLYSRFAEQATKHIQSTAVDPTLIDGLHTNKQECADRCAKPTDIGTWKSISTQFSAAVKTGKLWTYTFPCVALTIPNRKGEMPSITKARGFYYTNSNKAGAIKSRIRSDGLPIDSGRHLVGVHKEASPVVTRVCSPLYR